MKRLIGVAALLVAGCASIDRDTANGLQALGDNRYAFHASANLQWPLDDPEAEKLRMEWLDYKMKLNGFCPGGYRVGERQAVLQYVAALTGVGVYSLTYPVKCSD